MPRPVNDNNDKGLVQNATVNDHNNNDLIQNAMKHFTTAEMRAWRALDRETNRMWRNYWIRVLHRHGHSNVEIAEEFEIGESAVRKVLKE